MMQITCAQVLSELQHYKGKANGMHVSHLVECITGQSISTTRQERAVRKRVAELRLAGYPICAHPATGYFLAETAEELDETCNFLRSRAMSSMRAESRLRQISIAELLGTLQLTTTESTHP